MMSEGLNGIPPNSHLPGTSEHELVWKRGLCRCDNIYKDVTHLRWSHMR